MTSTLKTNTIEPEGATTNLVIGQSGQNTVISNNDIRANVLQDAGGNAVFTSNGSGVLSGVNSGFGSAMVLLSTQTASNSASVSITSGITSTYGEYIFKFYNINPDTNDRNFTFQVNAAGGSGYDETITSTMFRPAHLENDSYTILTYLTASDQAQGTAHQQLQFSLSNDDDNCLGGELHLFNPASTTYVKHFYSRLSAVGVAAQAGDWFTAGYINTTTAIDDIQFKMNEGNFDGTIKMWGVK